MVVSRRDHDATVGEQLRRVHADALAVLVIEGLVDLVEEEHFRCRRNGDGEPEPRAHPLRPAADRPVERCAERRLALDVRARARAPPPGSAPASTPSRSVFSRPVSEAVSPASMESSVPTRPATVSTPSSAGCTPAIARSRVVLPAPLEPSSATASPAPIVTLRPRRPQLSMTFRRRRAPPGVWRLRARSIWKRTPRPSAVIVVNRPPSRSGRCRGGTRAPTRRAGRPSRRAGSRASTDRGSFRRAARRGSSRTARSAGSA